jgi:hypothetical protein
MIKVLKAEELAERWHEIKPEVEAALTHGIEETTAHDIFVGAMNYQYECWEAIDDNTGNTLAFGMMRVNTFPQHKQLQFVTTAGEGFDIYGAEGLAHAEQVAKEIGCKYVTVWGRLGWTKKLKDYGYKHTYAVMTKEIK